MGEPLSFSQFSAIIRPLSEEVTLCRYRILEGAEVESGVKDLNVSGEQMRVGGLDVGIAASLIYAYRQG